MTLAADDENETDIQNPHNLIVTIPIIIVKQKNFTITVKEIGIVIVHTQNNTMHKTVNRMKKREPCDQIRFIINKTII